MTHRHQNALALLLVVPVALCLAAGGAQAQVQMHLDLQVGPVKMLDDAVPPNCSTWQELHPTPGTFHHQDAYEDDGDGFITPCDYIILDGARWHIIWVGPTYFMSCAGVNRVYEPTEPQTGENPTCQTWQQIWPDYGILTHVDYWVDNSNGVLDACDVVQIIDGWWHIDSIGLDIIVESAPTGIEQGSWGRIKQIFGGLF